MIREQVTPILDRILRTGSFILGEELEAFEDAFARYCGVSHCIGVGSGTDGLVMALQALGAGPGFEVIVPAYSFKATALAVLMTGARPVPVDVDPATGCIRPELVADAVTDKTLGMMPVHLYGHPADMDPLMEVARRLGLWVVEDACEAHGAIYRGRRVGSMGVVSVFSFYPSKNLGGWSDGGGIVTDDDGLAWVFRKRRGYGCDGMTGRISRLSSISAGVLGVKLPWLDRWNGARRDIAGVYRRELSGLPLKFMEIRDWAEAVYYLFVIKSDRRDELVAFLQGQGIEARIHFNRPLYREYDNFGGNYDDRDFPGAVELSRCVLSLPMHPWLYHEEVIYIAGKIREFFDK